MRRHVETGLLGNLDENLLGRVTLGERLVPDSVHWSAAVPHAVASNNWVLAGRKTESGSPILANDPHLEINRLPAVWYQIVLRLGERYCIAATMPGLPGPAIGRTNDLAWGATYTFMDAIDSWVEDCRDGKFRRTVDGRDEWVAFRVRHESIRRKHRAPVDVTFHEKNSRRHQKSVGGNPRPKSKLCSPLFCRHRGQSGTFLCRSICDCSGCQGVDRVLDAIAEVWNKKPKRSDCSLMYKNHTVVTTACAWQ